MSAPLELSLVIPVYNERDNLPVLVEEIGRALAGRAGGEPYEIVAVDDGSTDGSLDVLKVLKREHPEIHIVALAANAGQSAAFGAGFGAARGRVIVTLDADLQNDPADIPVLVAELERSGAAAVVGYRVGRRDSGWKRLQSRIANGVRNRLNRETIRDTGCSLKAFRAEALRSEEHTSELQSPCNLVCRLLLEKKKKNKEHYRRLQRDVSTHHVHLAVLFLCRLASW